MSFEFIKMIKIHLVATRTRMCTNDIQHVEKFPLSIEKGSGVPFRSI
jgi:hypothetical protein